jgi:hypothetical protein
MNAVVPVKGGQLQVAGLPEILLRAGANAVFAAEEFFKATINNLHTKRAYLRTASRLRVAQRMAGHSNAKTTGLHDRRNDEVSVGEVERIGI